MDLLVKSTYETETEIQLKHYYLRKTSNKDGQFGEMIYVTDAYFYITNM